MKELKSQMSLKAEDAERDLEWNDEEYFPDRKGHEEDDDEEDEDNDDNPLSNPLNNLSDPFI